MFAKLVISFLRLILEWSLQATLVSVLLAPIVWSCWYLIATSRGAEYPTMKEVAIGVFALLAVRYGFYALFDHKGAEK